MNAALRYMAHGTSISKQFPKLLAEAGIPSMKYHQLRYGAASLMAAAGHSPRTAMEVLGHSDISTTLGLYTRVTSQAQRDAVNSVGEAIWGAS